MRKLTFTIMCLFIAVNAFSQTKLGVQLAYGTNSEFGVGAKSSFGVTDAINISPSINYYFGESVGSASSSILTVNADGHYTFEGGNGLIFYPLAGLNLTRMSVSALGQSISNTLFGVNLGGGLNYGFSDSLTGVFETKYILSDANQAVFSAGILFNL